VIADSNSSESGEGRRNGTSGPNIVGVSLRLCGHIYHYLTRLDLKRGTRVLVESEAGTCLATVEAEPQEPAPTVDLSQLHPIIRVADERDLRGEEENRELEGTALRMCLQKVRERGLDMKLIGVEYTFDGRKAVFNFLSETRVDFRDLVRELAASLRVRIEMRQIGARDESKLSAGIASCGRELCCSWWLRDFAAITLKMAREQNLALNPSRLAGMCGRLKCCLRFEYATYLELKRGLPPVGKMVESVKGNGTVVALDVLKQMVMIQRADDNGVIEATLDDLLEKRP
jgi:cell fate regulator YaaT (PSP1 superfamily)